MLVSSETETTAAENAPTHAHHAHPPLLAHHVSKPEINQSTVFATAVSTHAHHALHLNNVLPALLDSASSMEDVPANAQLDQPQSMESASAPTDFSKTANVSHPAPPDGPTLMETANNVTATVVNAQARPPLVLHARLDTCLMVSVELVMLTEIVKSVSSSHQKLTSARESVQLDTHTKTHFVFLNVCQDSETMDSEVVLLKESLLVVHSHTSSNKAHVSQHATQVLIQTLSTEFVTLAHQTVSHACHLPSVPAAAQVSISRTTSVSLVKDVLTTN